MKHGVSGALSRNIGDARVLVGAVIGVAAVVCAMLSIGMPMHNTTKSGGFSPSPADPSTEADAVALTPSPACLQSQAELAAIQRALARLRHPPATSTDVDKKSSSNNFNNKHHDRVVESNSPQTAEEPSSPAPSLLEQLTVAVKGSAIERCMRTQPAIAYQHLAASADMLSEFKAFESAVAVRRKALETLEGAERASSRHFQNRQRHQQQRNQDGEVTGVKEGGLESDIARIPHDASEAAREQVTQTVALATDMYLSFDFDGALRVLERVRESAGLPPDARSMVLRLESAVHECRGDLATSLLLFETSLKQPGFKPTMPLIQHHCDLLQRVTTLPQLPGNVAAAMGKKLSSLGRLLVASGPWSSTQQLPRRYIPGLTATPWHSLASCSAAAGGGGGGTAGAGGDGDGAVCLAVSLLEAMTSELLGEFESLQARGLLEPERECIRDTARGGGFWERYEATAFWRPLDAATGCSTDTPAACAAMRAIEDQAGLRVLRAGYSVLGPGTVLKPHYGMTNGQLKLHLGLDVPTLAQAPREEQEEQEEQEEKSKDGRKGRGDKQKGEMKEGENKEEENKESVEEEKAPCAFLTVGEETRSWQTGKVLFFDDSFVHSVRNECPRQRVVFQVVFAHPELVAMMAQAQAADHGTGEGAAAIEWAMHEQLHGATFATTPQDQQQQQQHHYRQPLLDVADRATFTTENH